MPAITTKEVFDYVRREGEFFDRLDNFFLAFSENIKDKYITKIIRDESNNKSTTIIISKKMPWHKRAYSAFVWKLRHHRLIKASSLPEYDINHGISLHELRDIKNIANLCFVGLKPVHSLKKIYKDDVEMLRHTFEIKHEF